MRNGIRSLPRYQQGGLHTKEENRRRAMAGERGYATIGPRPPWAERVAAQVRSVPGRINRALQPETAGETAALVGASMIPGVGEGIDIADIVAGARTGDIPRMGWGALGFALPFVAGSALRQFAKRRNAIFDVKTNLAGADTGEVIDVDWDYASGYGPEGRLSPLRDLPRRGIAALRDLPSRISRKWEDLRLPMDEASVARRIDEQGYEELLHGTGRRGEALSNAPLDPDRAFFQVDNPDVAEAYGETRRVYSRKPNQLAFDAEGAPWMEIPIEKIRRQIDPGRLEEFDQLARISRRPGSVEGHLDTDALSGIVRKMGYSGFDAQNLRDAPWTGLRRVAGDVADAPSFVRSTIDPGLVRYEGARFDPRDLGLNRQFAGITGLLGVGATGAARRNYVERDL